MKNNLGSIDKIIRIALALLIAVLYFTQTVTGTLGIILLILAGVLFLTSAIGFCPLYFIMNIKTLNKKK